MIFTNVPIVITKHKQTSQTELLAIPTGQSPQPKAAQYSLTVKLLTAQPSMKSAQQLNLPLQQMKATALLAGKMAMETLFLKKLHTR